MKALILLACLVAYVNAHACLMYPHQRGIVRDLTTAGSDDCLLLNGPCGGMRPNITADGITEFIAGAYTNIIFQKNKDHFNPRNPGYWMIRVARSDTDPDWYTLYSVPDSEPDERSGQRIYSVSVKMPSYPMDSGVLQLTYHTNNDEAPPDFYQCADIRLISTLSKSN